MRTLILMRHAKSAYPPGVGDHERPLAPRGIREATLAGEWLHANVPGIDAVLCSTATRTRETLAHAEIDAAVRYVEELYGASPGMVIDEINSAATAFGDDVETLMVIGHEPAMAHVALGLAGAPGTNITAAEHISTKYPTSAIAVLRTDARWSALAPGGAALITFHVPR